MNAPQPGETWIARDGRVAQVIAFSPRKCWLQIEYSGDNEFHICYPDGRFAGGCSPRDLVRRSPWDAIRDIIRRWETPETDKRMFNPCCTIWSDAMTTLHASRKQFIAAEDIQSEALEFVAWAELQGLTPENLAEMRRKVAP